MQNIRHVHYSYILVRVLCVSSIAMRSENTARKQQNKATLIGFSTSILVSKILYSYQNGKVTAKMLMRRSYLTLGVTIVATLRIRVCSTGYN